MSYPILYNATETDFDNNGIGILSSCTFCEVVEEGNGIFELSMTYPMDGIHFEQIRERSIIKAKADQFRDPQLFRVYAISKPMSGIVRIDAQHISYDLSGVPVTPFSAKSAKMALGGIMINAAVSSPFVLWTDIESTAEFVLDVPSSVRSCLGGGQGSILDVYGGEYEFDNFSVNLYSERGKNRGVSIRYGKNLTSLQQDQNCLNVATGIYPYWFSETENEKILVTLPEKIVNVPGSKNFVKILTVDLSQYFESQPTEEQLREEAEKYISDHNLSAPIVSLNVSYAQLAQHEEYKHLALLERVGLFDVVNVEFPEMGVSATAKAVKIVYNVIAERVESVTLGSVRANIADTIVEQKKEIEKIPTSNELKRVQEAATKWLTNGKGYAYFRKDDFGNILDILFMDTQDVNTATDVMRVGQSGIGFSHNGVDGPYESAWTIDGVFNANFIAAGALYGLLFKAGAIESEDGKIRIDLSSGNMPVFNTGIRTNDKFVVMDQEENFPLFLVERSTNSSGIESFNLAGFDGSYNSVFRVSRLFDSESGDVAGTALSVNSDDSFCHISVSDYSPSITLRGNGGDVALGVNESWNGAYLSLPNEKTRTLFWAYSPELGKHVLCGD